MSINFYNPKNIGTTEIGATQINKVIPFKTVNGVFITSPVVKVYLCGKLIKEYTINNGLELTGTNQQGTEKTLSLTLSGTDYTLYKKKDLDAQCTFFVLGDIEIVFKINIV